MAAVKKERHALPAPVRSAIRAPSEVVRAEFAANLNSRMIEKGWNQAELARRASAYLPKGSSEVSRVSVSTYCSGKTIPRPAHLAALAKALSCEPIDLTPSHVVSSGSSAALNMQDAGDNMAYLRVNVRLPWDVALQVAKLIRSAAPE